MKKISLVFTAMLMLSFTVKAQETKKEHSIKVIGTAELEIVPDEIYMAVTLKEYTKDKKKYNIEELEKNLVNYVEKVTATDKKDIKMSTMDAYLITLKRKKNKDEVITKSYTIKFKNSQQIYQLYSVMDSLSVSNAYVSKYSHSKMDEYKKQIKINAIKAARDKADYLMLAIGQVAGKAISVAEPSGFVTIDDGLSRGREYNTYGKFSNVSQSYGGYPSSGDSDDEGSIMEKTIKLRYDLNAEFEIKGTQ